MMHQKNNYMSIVGLGHFNPGILTPIFLKDVCKLHFPDPPRGETTPVISRLNYGKVSFLVELERMQVKEDEVVSYKDSKIIDYFTRYITTLQYTPLFLCGVNLNTTVHEFNPKKINHKIEDIKLISQLLESTTMMIDRKEKLKDDTKDWKIYNFKTLLPDRMALQLNFKKENAKIIINLNYEVGGFNNSLEKIKKLNQGIEMIINKNNVILESFF